MATTSRTTPQIYRFGSVEVRLDAHQLVGAAGPVEVEPRVFDLLVFLIEQRTRIVSKDELLDEIWKTSFVSESVLARAVMKGRKALADAGGDSDWIRTAHRVGYQFIAERDVELKTDFKHEAESQASHLPRVTLMPFENQTGDPLLDWVELGLLTLVARSISAEGSLAVDPTDTSLAALTSMPSGATHTEKVLRLRAALGTPNIAHVSVSTNTPDDYRLSWKVWLPDNVVREGFILGAQVPGLARKCARQLISAVVPAEEAPAAPSFAADDAFAMAAHGRALQAFAQENFASALSLMQICIDMTPNDLARRADYVLMTSVMDSTKAEDLATALLPLLSWDNHPKERIIVLRALADAALRVRNWSASTSYCDEAEPHMHAQRDYESYRAFEICRFTIAFNQGDLKLARDIGEAWVTRARNADNIVDLIAALAAYSKIDLWIGDWDAGRKLVLEAIDLARLHRLTASLGGNLSNLALAHLWRARLRESVELRTEALQRVRKSGRASDLLPVLVNCYLAAMEQGETQAAKAYIAELSAAFTRNTAGALSIGVAIADAKMRFGDIKDAGSFALNAIHQIEQVPGLHQAMGAYLTVLVASSALDEAQGIQQRARDSYGASSTSPAHVSYLLAAAQFAYANGKVRQAYGLVERYVAARGGLIRSFHGCTDLMWLALDAGRIDEAADISSEITDHLTETLRGRLLSARLCYERGHLDQAIELQQQVIAMGQGRRVLPYFHSLLAHYEAKAGGAPKSAIPRSTIMPSAF